VWIDLRPPATSAAAAGGRILKGPRPWVRLREARPGRCPLRARAAPRVGVGGGTHERGNSRQSWRHDSGGDGRRRRGRGGARACSWLRGEVVRATWPGSSTGGGRPARRGPVRSTDARHRVHRVRYGQPPRFYFYFYIFLDSHQTVNSVFLGGIPVPRRASAQGSSSSRPWHRRRRSSTCTFASCCHSLVPRTTCDSSSMM